MTFLAQNRIIVIIKRHNRHGNTNKHLRELEERNKDGVEPFGTAFDRHQKVVTVHHRVDGVVHNHEEETGWTGGYVGMPAVEQYGDVMVPMEED